MNGVASSRAFYVAQLSPNTLPWFPNRITISAHRPGEIQGRILINPAIPAVFGAFAPRHDDVA